MEVVVGASAGGDWSISSCLSRLAVGVHWVGDSVDPRVGLELTETCELSVSVEQEAQFPVMEPRLARQRVRNGSRVNRPLHLPAKTAHSSLLLVASRFAGAAEPSYVDRRSFWINMRCVAWCRNVIFCNQFSSSRQLFASVECAVCVKTPRSN